MTENEFILASQKLFSINQQHLFQDWHFISEAEKKSLLSQIDHLNLLTYSCQKNLLSTQVVSSIDADKSPFEDYEKKGNKEDLESGQKLIAEGKVGCLIVAGGQGSRLRFEGPKGLFPVSVIKQKSLFQLVFERVKAAGKQVDQVLQLAIMTSPSNHETTIEFIKDNHYFGLKPSQVQFFSQDMLPLLDQKGDLFLEEKGKIAEGAAGNGACFKHFVESGVWDRWQQLGIEYVNFVQIDNPLADPFDAELIGFQNRHHSDVVVKCVVKERPEEKVGVVINKGGKACVVEYTEISKEEASGRKSNGMLNYACANISLFSFRMDFIRKVNDVYYNEMPFHTALKAVKILSSDGQSIMAESPIAWKFEKYIFDVLPFAKNVKVLLYPREECFAPLKNNTGTDSLESVRNALQLYDRKVFSEISGFNVSEERMFELDPQFYYPTTELLQRWKGKPLPETGYISAD